MSNRLLKSTFVVGFFTLLSRISGFVRDMIFARMFGATAGMEAFLVAFKIPNFMRRLFAEGSFTQAFVPVLSEYKTKYSHKEMVDFIRNVAGTLGVILLLLTAFGMIFSSAWVLVFAPGFYGEPEKFHMASQMLSITFPYIFSIALTALAGSVMNCFSRFAVPAFTPVLLNASMIIFALNADYFSIPVYALAWGVFTAGFIQLAFQIPFLIKLKVLAWPKWGWHHLGVKKLMILMVPALFGASVAQISLLLDTIFASFLPTGSISWLYYADRLNQFPLGVFGVALSTVVLPHLSKHHANQDQSRYNGSLDWALRLVFLLALPAAVGLMCLSGPMLTSLFNYGQFNQHDVLETQKTLVAFSVGLFSFIMVKVLVSAFYSRQNMKTPVKIGVIALTSNMILNAILVLALIPYGLGHVGLAVATSISSFINGILLFYMLKKLNLYQALPGWLFFLMRIFIACAVMASILLYFQGAITEWFNYPFHDRISHLLMLIVMGGIAYFAVLVLLGMRRKHFIHHQ